VHASLETTPQQGLRTPYDVVALLSAKRDTHSTQFRYNKAVPCPQMHQIQHGERNLDGNSMSMKHDHAMQLTRLPVPATFCHHGNVVTVLQGVISDRQLSWL
jgi:hypothetical protein